MQTLKQILVSLLQRITKYAHTTVYIVFLIAFLFLYTQYREFNGGSLQIRTYTDPIVRVETKTVYKDRVIEKQTQCVQTKVIIPNSCEGISCRANQLKELVIPAGCEWVWADMKSVTELNKVDRLYLYI